MHNDTCVIGTRGSALALWQAHAVKRAIEASRPDVSCEIRVIKTTGDRNLATPLAEIGDKGLFTKDLEAALVAGEVDICVHSMKDVPTELADGCGIVAMLERADARDVIVCGPRIQAACLADVPAGSRLGTGSLRRVAQIRAGFPGIVPTPIRGNVDTRIAKACGEEYEGAVLAAAGVTRMGLADRISAYIPVSEIVPAVGQGAVGIEARLGDERVCELCARIDDAATRVCVEAERIVLCALEGGCQVPMGAYMRFDGGDIAADAVVASVDGSRVARVALRVPASDATPADVARRVLAELSAQGADVILEEIRAQEAGR